MGKNVKWSKIAWWLQLLKEAITYVFAGMAIHKLQGRRFESRPCHHNLSI